MKATVTAIPCRYGQGYRELIIGMGTPPLAREEIEVRNIAQLDAALAGVRAQVNQDAMLIIRPLGRKFPGFDAHLKANPDRVEVRINGGAS